MIRTHWGYEVDAEALPPLVSVGDFVTMTGGAFDVTDGRLEPALAAASAAVRNWCGWHVSPALTCHCEAHADGLALELPSKAVESVTSVEVADEVLDPTTYEWRRDGMVRRLPPFRWPHGWRAIEVEYVSGYEIEDAPDLAAVVCQIAANNVAAAPGVRRESAGGVSIDYNSTGGGVAGGTVLLERDKALLGAYRLPAVPR